jgi:hypothetical protein
MAPSSRDRISVDLRGLKAALYQRAKLLGTSPSDVVRGALAVTLSLEPEEGASRWPPPAGKAAGRVRMSLRMTAGQAKALSDAARNARQSTAAYLCDLADGVPVAVGGADRPQYVSALLASNAELAALSRNLNHLGGLLHKGQGTPARVYRAMLDTLVADVWAHLALASRVLVELQPRRPAGSQRQTP